jgi:hypothetical protein
MSDDAFNAPARPLYSYIVVLPPNAALLSARLAAANKLNAVVVFIVLD